MSDDNHKDDTGPQSSGPDWVAVGAVGLAAIGTALLGKKLIKSVGEFANGAPKARAGEGRYRSATYGGGFCPDHQCKTTHKDGDEYWCPHCWNMTMQLFYRL